jgi:adenylyltransferase/sulfurtransferase
VFPELPEPGTYPSAAELGVVGAAAGVMGALEGVEALKLLLGVGDTLADRLLLWDGLHGTFDVVSYTRNPRCPVCG